MHTLPVLAHPLLQAGALPLPPLVVALLGAAAVIAVAFAGGQTSTPAPRPESPTLPGTGGWPARAAGLALLALAVAGGLWGTNVVTDNLAPALVLGVGWPLLVVVSVAGFAVWAHANPWDTLAAGFAPVTGDRPGADAGAPAARDVRWALPAAAAVAGYVSAYRGALLPRSIALALLGYTLVTVAGCLVLGRREWLTRAEPLGLVLGWFTLVRSGRLTAWRPPRGAGAVLGLLIAGWLFAALRYTELLDPVVFGLPRLPAEPVGLAIVAVVVVGVLAAGERRCSGAGLPGTAVAAVVPLAAGLALTAAMVRGQLLLAAQLLPVVAGDPFGRGWDLLGTAGWTPNPNPLGDAGHTAVEVALVMAGGLLGAGVVRRRTAVAHPGARRARGGATATVVVLVAAGLVAVTVT